MRSCTLIGNIVLDRPLQPFLISHQEHQVDQVLDEIRAQFAGPLSTHREEFAQLLASRMRLEPLELTSGWSEMEEIAGEQGRAQFIRIATYAGSPTLWRFGPDETAPKRKLRAILDSGTVTLQARSPKAGRANPEYTLAAAISQFTDRLGGVGMQIGAFNDQLVSLANQWSRHMFDRASDRDRIAVTKRRKG